VVTLLETPGLRIHANRTGGAWVSDHPEHEHNTNATHDTPTQENNSHINNQETTPDHQNHTQSPDTQDPHIWLDPTNAQRLVQAIATTLIEVDPSHASRYQQNAITLTEKLDALSRQLAKQLTPIQNRPYRFPRCLPLSGGGIWTDAGGIGHPQPRSTPWRKTHS
jgi:zinc transport system substrate-binding protein